jgi:hypothetical protein
MSNKIGIGTPISQSNRYRPMASSVAGGTENAWRRFWFRPGVVWAGSLA